MKILVCISKAPDTTTKIAFTDGDTKFDETGVKYIVNPYDEWYALVRGIELKEANGGSVTTITVGTADDEPTIRKALAIGADNAVRINTEAKDASQVGAMLAEHLDMPFLSLASRLDVNGTTASLDKDIVGGVQTVEVDLPIVVSSAKGMAEARIPNMRGIMAARTKPLEVLEPSNAEAKTSFVKYGLPAPKSAVKLIDPENMDELVELLHNEAKVI